MFGFVEKLCGAPNSGGKTTNASRSVGNMFGGAKKRHLTVYEEALIMLNGSLTIYLVSDLRELARKGKATVELKDLETPITIDKVMGAIKDNTSNLIEHGSYDNDLEGRLHALENLNLHTKGLFGMFGKTTTRVVEFVDTNAENELVHAITVNDDMKRITVIFRGSVTTTDFITDAKVAQTKLPNPVKQLDEESPENIHIHCGFHEYLFKKKCPNTGKPRYESILDSVHKLLEENPGYDVYCTGHSLGAALSTYFGFNAAANEKTSQLCKDPIRVVSIASPYVGNSTFLLAFQGLERLGRIRHLRIANAEDVVTLMPVFAPKAGMISPVLALVNGVGNFYKHCGMKLLLRGSVENEGDPIHTITYAQDQSTDDKYAEEIKALFEDGKNFMNSVKLVFKKQSEKVVAFHGCDEYERRLNLCKTDLASKTLDGLYKDKSIVGDVLDEGYKPVVMTGTKQRIERISASDKLKEAIFGKKLKE